MDKVSERHPYVERKGDVEFIELGSQRIDNRKCSACDHTWHDGPCSVRTGSLNLSTGEFSPDETWTPCLCAHDVTDLHRREVVSEPLPAPTDEAWADYAAWYRIVGSGETFQAICASIDANGRHKVVLRDGSAFLATPQAR